MTDTQKVDADPPEELALGLGHVDVPGADKHAHGLEPFQGSAGLLQRSGQLPGLLPTLRLGVAHRAEADHRTAVPPPGGDVTGEVYLFDAGTGVVYLGLLSTTLAVAYQGNSGSQSGGTSLGNGHEVLSHARISGVAMVL